MNSKKVLSVFVIWDWYGAASWAWWALLQRRKRMSPRTRATPCSSTLFHSSTVTINGDITDNGGGTATTATSGRSLRRTIRMKQESASTEMDATLLLMNDDTNSMSPSYTSATPATPTRSGSTSTRETGPPPPRTGTTTTR